VGETTVDDKFTLETVNCIGCCAIGPVVVVDEKYYSNVTLNKIDPILKEYKEDNS
jgi:NADH-quinone oxidoreductase subunit E